MMQAIVCTTEIGWRQKARHLIVFSTDAIFHIAGDGKVREPSETRGRATLKWTDRSQVRVATSRWKSLTVSQLAGIVEPNDCKCHLDNKGFYTHSLLQDYPSISQVRTKGIFTFFLRGLITCVYMYVVNLIAFKEIFNETFCLSSSTEKRASTIWILSSPFLITKMRLISD